MANKSDMAKRIESEAMAITSPTNNDLKCKDCLFRYPDDICPGNVSMCEKYPEIKPTKVLFEGGDCYEYLKE